MQKKELYKNKSHISFNELDEYFSVIIEFDSNSMLSKIIKKIISNKEDINKSEVWALFGYEKDWTCLQVAKSIDIFSEIIDDIKLMYNDEVSLVDYSMWTITKNTEFYLDTYRVKETTKNKSYYMYRIIKNKYSKFKVCVLDIDKYLGINNIDSEINNNVSDIISLGKGHFAEAKFAYETQAIYWNKYAPNLDGQAIKLFNSRKNNATDKQT